MKKLLAGILVAMSASGTIAHGAAEAPLELWRLDCGRFEIDDLEGRGPVSMPVSCYLVRRGDELIMFDAGLPADLHKRPQRQEGQTLHVDRTLDEQLAAIGVDPGKVTTLIVSHYHGDHHGQAGLFPNARLLIGAGDAAALRREREQGALAPWLTGQRPVVEIGADQNLLDGQLVVLFTPGHTPGHLSILVSLKGSSYVLTGDLVHSREQLTTGEPSGNHVDKVRGKAEIERVLALAEKNDATIVVGHDRGDIALLPAFPAAAR